MYPARVNEGLLLRRTLKFYWQESLGKGKARTGAHWMMKVWKHNRSRSPQLGTKFGGVRSTMERMTNELLRTLQPQTKLSSMEAGALQSVRIVQSTLQ